MQNLATEGGRAQGGPVLGRWATDGPVRGPEVSPNAQERPRCCESSHPSVRRARKPAASASAGATSRGPRTGRWHRVGDLLRTRPFRDHPPRDRGSIGGRSGRPNTNPDRTGHDRHHLPRRLNDSVAQRPRHPVHARGRWISDRAGVRPPPRGVADRDLKEDEPEGDTAAAAESCRAAMFALPWRDDLHKLLLRAAGRPGQEAS